MRQSTRLENGLTVLTAEMPHMASVSVGIWVGVGGRHEAENLSGASHFIEHLLFKGTRRRNARQISEAVEGLGGYLNAFTSEEHTCFYAKAAAGHFDQLLDVLTDMLLHSVFDPKEIDKERDVIKEEIAMYLDQPSQHVQELLNATMWPNQPLGRSITGSPATLDKIGRPQLLEYLRGHYVAPATVIAIAGNITHSRALKAVKKIARRFPPGHRSSCAPAVTDQAKPFLALHTKKTEQTQIALGIRACSRHDDRRFALRVMSAILGENMSSRLFQTVREDQGLAYSIYSSVSFFDDVGDLVVSSGLDTDNLDKLLKTVLREMDRLANRLVPLGELRRARDYLIGQLDLSLENSENQMMWLGEQWLGYGRVFPPDSVKAKLSAVQPAQVRAAAQAFFRPERYTLALVSPLKTVCALPKPLRSR